MSEVKIMCTYTKLVPVQQLVEQIEELIGEDEPVLVRIRTNLIQELKRLTGYEYIL